jgi:hypothetical protein
VSAAIYIVCALTSLVCALLLLRGYQQRGPRLLLWSSLCFFGLTADNIILFVDLVIFPTEISLLVLRNLASVVGLALLIFGLVWETK